MSNDNVRRDEVTDRLSSFLFKEGKLSIVKVSGIKRHVLLIETKNNNKYILKRHKNKDILFQQWNFFKAIDSEFIIPFQPFPNGREVLTHRDNYFTIAPYVEGKKLNYKFAEDRNSVVHTVKSFHTKARNIYIPSPVNKKFFFVRWYDRLQAFKQTEAIFTKHGFDYLYKDIVQLTGFHLRLLSQFPWDQLEREAKWNGTWVHGDVASHNFIQSGSNTCIIDFDLLQCTTQLYDFIQLGQRFLPHVNWDLEALIRYNMVSDVERKIWAYALAVPSDVIREWLHFLNKKSTGLYNYLYQLDEAWASRRYFLKNIGKVLN